MKKKQKIAVIGPNPIQSNPIHGWIQSMSNTGLPFTETEATSWSTTTLPRLNTQRRVPTSAFMLMKGAGHSFLSAAYTGTRVAWYRQVASATWKSSGDSSLLSHWLGNGAVAEVG